MHYSTLQNGLLWASKSNAPDSNDECFTLKAAHPSFIIHILYCFHVVLTCNATWLFTNNRRCRVFQWWIVPGTSHYNISVLWWKNHVQWYHLALPVRSPLHHVSCSLLFFSVPYVGSSCQMGKAHVCVNLTLL